MSIGGWVLVGLAHSLSGRLGLLLLLLIEEEDRFPYRRQSNAIQLHLPDEPELPRVLGPTIHLVDSVGLFHLVLLDEHLGLLILLLEIFYDLDG